MLRSLAQISGGRRGACGYGLPGLPSGVVL